jgi:hypothetical protein
MCDILSVCVCSDRDWFAYDMHYLWLQIHAVLVLPDTCIRT